MLFFRIRSNLRQILFFGFFLVSWASYGHAELLFERNVNGTPFEFHRYEHNRGDDEQAVQLLENASILKSSVTHSYREIL